MNKGIRDRRDRGVKEEWAEDERFGCLGAGSGVQNKKRFISNVMMW